MGGLREWLSGRGGRRSLRQARVSEGQKAIARSTIPPPRLRHSLTLLALGLGMSGLIAAIVIGRREPSLRQTAGGILLVGTLNTLFFLYLLTFRRGVLRSRAKASLICVLALLVLVLARLSTVMPGWPPHLVPVTLATVVLAVVFDRRFALETSWMLLLYVGAILTGGRYGSGEAALRSLIVLSAGMLVAVLATGRIRTRSKIIQVGLLVGAVQLLAVAGLRLDGGGLVSDRLLAELFWGLAHGVLVGFVVSGSLPFIEYTFRVSTDISLLELGDISQQTVLRRLLVAAPGTYNHSLIVGMLAEHAAEAIDANPLLARVGGYYHDVGKMLKPEYYGENEVIPGLHHRQLSPTMSTLIIRAHVKDGVELAKHHDLPKPIVDIIEQHHGTTLVEFFFDEARKRARKGERVQESVFRYPGPKPQTKEAGIMMLADSVEAATRSLSDPAPARIESTIKRISERKLADGQLDECGLTLKEVRLIDEAFVRVLAGIFHRRPRYPEIVRSQRTAPSGEPSPEAAYEPERMDYFTAT